MSTYNENQNTTKPRKAPKEKKLPRPAVTREDGRVTINAELVDDLFVQTIANLMALQVVWEKISLKEELQ
jgi:hypothetical protein